MAKLRDEDSEMEKRPRICAVMVLFRPDEGVKTNVALLMSQVDDFIIIDNSPAGADRSIANDLHLAFPQATLISNHQNLGLAHALNQGIAYACRLRFEWILTMDQDSEPPTNFVDCLFRSLYACPFKDSVAVVGPLYRDRKTNALMSSVDPIETTYREVLTTMTSGNLVRVTAIEDCGCFREDFFIDYVDHEFCLRLRRFGWRIIESCSATLVHSLGALCRYSMLGRTISVTHHSSIRHYYISRNRLTTVWLYWNDEPRWAVCQIFYSFTHFIKMLLFEDDKADKLAMTGIGAVHAALHRLGAHPKSLAD